MNRHTATARDAAGTGHEIPASSNGKAVQEMFSRIALRYDLLNSLLSLGLDRSWRREAARVALEGEAQDLLDAATGTGELALELKRLSPGSTVTALDFARPMLDIARQKLEGSGLAVELVSGDVLELPFEDCSFDAVTIAYGLRNLADRRAGLLEMKRVLRPGGRLVVLEFPPPPEGLFGRLFAAYFRYALPFLGGLISGSRPAYDYLPASVLAFPRPSELAALIRDVGFTGVRYRLLSLGVSAIHVGEKK